MSDEAMRAAFEAWWETNGQFGRAGGGEYEKTFAFNAWQAATLAERERAAKVCDELDRIDRPSYEITATDCANWIRTGETP